MSYVDLNHGQQCALRDLLVNTEGAQDQVSRQQAAIVVAQARLVEFEAARDSDFAMLKSGMDEFGLPAPPVITEAHMDVSSGTWNGRVYLNEPVP